MEESGCHSNPEVYVFFSGCALLCSSIAKIVFVLGFLDSGGPVPKRELTGS